MLAASAVQRSSENCLSAPIAQFACVRAMCWRLPAESVSMSMVEVSLVRAVRRREPLGPAGRSLRMAVVRKRCACDYSKRTGRTPHCMPHRAHAGRMRWPSSLLLSTAMHSHEAVKQLDVIPADELATRLPLQVLAQLPQQGVTVFSVTDDASDTAAFSARYGFGLEDCANTIVVRYKKDGGEHYAALVSL